MKYYLFEPFGDIYEEQELRDKFHNNGQFFVCSANFSAIYTSFEKAMASGDFKELKFVGNDLAKSFASTLENLIVISFARGLRGSADALLSLQMERDRFVYVDAEIAAALIPILQSFIEEGKI